MALALELLYFAALSFITSATICAAQNGGDSSSGAAVELWCVAKNNAEDAALQNALDWACGQGGADCSAIQQGGPCYDSSDIQKTASFAFNDYFLKHGLTQDSCNFDNTAALTSLNPSKISSLLFSSSLFYDVGFLMDFKCIVLILLICFCLFFSGHGSCKFPSR